MKAKSKIIIAVIEGRYFNRKPHSKVYFQCTFQQQLLLTEPTELLSEPIFDTHMVWEIDQKLLHYLRSQRSSLKLLCYSIDSDTGVRDSVGFVMLDLRNTSGLPWKEAWYPLIHSKTQVKPEVKLAFALADGSELPPPLQPRSGKESLQEANLMSTVKVDQISPGEYCLDGRRTLSTVWEFKVNEIRNDEILLQKNSNLYLSVSFLGDSIPIGYYDVKEKKIIRQNPEQRVILRGSKDSYRRFLIEMRKLDLILLAGGNVVGYVEVPLGVVEKNFVGETFIMDELLPIRSASKDPIVYSTGQSPLISISLTLHVEKGSIAIASDAELQMPTNSDSSLHQYRFSIDLRSVHNVHIPTANVYLKYSYSPFGTHATICTHPSIKIFRNQQTVIPNSFCGYEFVMSEEQLHNYIYHVPLIVEMWHRDTEISDREIGVVSVRLATVFTGDERKLEAGNIWSVDRFVPVVARGVFGDVQKICDVRVLLSLEDFGSVHDSKEDTGPARIIKMAENANNVDLPVENITTEFDSKSILNISNNVSIGSLPPFPKKSTDSINLNEQRSERVDVKIGKTENVSDRSLYKDKLLKDLEDWKKKEENDFMEHLKKKEELFLTALSSEWKKKESEREATFEKKMSQFEQMEDKVKATIIQLEHRERKILDAEQELKYKLNQFEAFKERTLTDIKDSGRRLQEEYQHKLEIEKSRSKDLETQRSQLKTELKHSQDRYRELEEDFRLFRLDQQTTPITALSVEIDQLKHQISNLESKLSASEKSKKYYKFEWAKVLAELAKLRSSMQREAEMNLIQEKKEIMEMKKNFSVRSSLMDMPNEETIPRKPLAEKNVKTSTELDNLLKEKDLLISSGVYDEKDPLIQYIDAQIAQIS